MLKNEYRIPLAKVIALSVVVGIVSAFACTFVLRLLVVDTNPAVIGGVVGGVVGAVVPTILRRLK